MFQDYVTYQATAAENIGLGELGRIEDREAVEEAARKGGADSLLERLPDGWDTPLGKWFDGGVELSGGEWQKIALGRAFMRDARILVLDEPTSALDAQAEFELFARLRRLAAGRDRDLHLAPLLDRPSGRPDPVPRARHASSRRGPTSELMALGGRYARLFTLQAAAYTGASIEGLVDMGGIVTEADVDPDADGDEDGSAGPSRPATAGDGAGRADGPGLQRADDPRMRPRRRSLAVATVAGTALAVGGSIARYSAGDRLSARTERRLNRVVDPGPYALPAAVADLHERLTVVDLHADSLLWGRDLLRRADRGSVDVPRMVEGNVALQVFAVATKVPRHLNYERNDDRSDDVTLVALVQGWPAASWRSLLARRRAPGGAAAPRWRWIRAGQLTLIRTTGDLDRYLERRTGDLTLIRRRSWRSRAPTRSTATCSNVDRLDAAGYRMVGLAHFFDNHVAGSAHGVDKGGLTDAGRDLVSSLERRRILVDLVHASEATIDDVLRIATRPVVVSHTGVRGVADNDRNLSDDQLRRVAATGGVVGIGFWPTACGGDDVDWIARSIVHAVAVVGADHVALGSDFDGAVPVPFDASGMGLLTGALLGQGLDRPRSPRSWAAPRSGCFARPCLRPDRLPAARGNRRIGPGAVPTIPRTVGTVTRPPGAGREGESRRWIQ